MKFRSYSVAPAGPCWSGQTYLRAVQCLLAGRVVRGPYLERFSLLIEHHFPDRRVVLCGSGTLALELALRRCGIRPGDEVVVPTFCCSTIVRPIFAVGAVPVFADCGDDLNVTPESIDAVLTNRTKAILVAHLFGNPAAIERIVEIATARRIRVIDDAAQAIGARVNSRAAGTFGDAGILSFGAEKVLPGIGGGALLLPKSNENFACDELMSPGGGRAALHLVSTFLQRRWPRLTAPLCKFGIGRDAPDPELAPVAYRKERIANLNAAIAAAGLERISENIAARRLRLDAYQEFLGGDERLQLVSHGPGSACLSQIVRILPQSRCEDLAAQVVDVLAIEGYRIHGSYIPVHLLAPFREFARKRLRYAENAWPDLIELPCEPHVRVDDVERIAAIVKRLVCGG